MLLRLNGEYEKAESSCPMLKTSMEGRKQSVCSGDCGKAHAVRGVCISENTASKRVRDRPNRENSLPMHAIFPTP